MGLDQFAFAVKAKKITKKLGVTILEENRKKIDLAYWRKHPNLQGWMEQKYREKGGTEVFNCVNVELTIKDLKELKAAVMFKKLPETCGFFFGQDSDEHYADEDIKFIEKAIKFIEDGYQIYYTSWW